MKRLDSCVLALVVLAGPACIVVEHAGSAARPPDECRADSECRGATPLCARQQDGVRRCGCPDGALCPDGAVCRAGGCGPCRSAADCPGGRVCDAGLCRRCSADAECGAGNACRAGVCGHACTGDAECLEIASRTGLGAFTEGASIFGCRAVPGFPSEIDLCDRDPRATWFVCDACDPADRGCHGGDRVCSTSEACPDGPCRDGVCGACRSDADCGCGRACERGRCVAACTSDAECAARGMGVCLAGGRCAFCATDADCSGGRRCYDNGCVVPCQVDHACGDISECTESGRCGVCRNHVLGPPALPFIACR